MCGIIGIMSYEENAKKLAVSCLKNLEYRGYDSAGVAVISKEGLILNKALGKINNLEQKLCGREGNVAIAHTRWATHGKATLENTHPHYDETQRFIITHNGTIENYQELKNKFCQKRTLYGQTDSEVIANVLAVFVEEGMIVHQAIQKLMQHLKGSYALTILDTQAKNVLYFAKNKSPLIVGKSEKGIFLASDILAVNDHATDYFELQNFEFGEIRNYAVTLWNIKGEKVVPRFQRNEDFMQQEQQINKGTYEHFMLKEIEEQPKVLQKILDNYTNDYEYLYPQLLLDVMKKNERITIIAAGTSYHAAAVIARFFNQYTDKYAHVYLASEFSYSEAKFEPSTCYFFFSQSGETADCIAAFERVKKINAPTITVTNRIKSTLARTTDFCLPIHAGVEVSVASTKAYVAQIATVLGLLYAYLGVDVPVFSSIIDEAEHAMNDILHQQENVKKWVKNNIIDQQALFYIGRQLGHDIAIESALKLKEISYIHAEGVAAGELKHGTIALIEKNTPVIAFITDSKTADFTRSNIEEVKARDANIYIISTQNLSQKEDNFIISAKSEQAIALSMVVIGQLIAYYAALLRGNDVDMPRNLTKSVTVE